MIELIYLHIPFARHQPKLKDKSFKRTLRSAYGENTTVQVHIIDGEDDLALLGGGRAQEPRQTHTQEPPRPAFLQPFLRILDSKRLDKLAQAWQVIFQEQAAPANHKYRYSLPEVLPEGARVIHGSFSYGELLKKYGLSRDIPLLTWMGDPVDRVVSSYFGLHRVVCEAMKHAAAPPGVLRRMERTLIEFARQEINRNGVSKLLAGLSMKDFIFVGIVEHFKEDLHELAGLLHWDRYATFFDDKSEHPKMIVSREMRAQIAELNQDDVELYREAGDLRQERRAQGQE